MSMLSATNNLLWKDSSPLDPAHGSAIAHQTKFIFILWQPGSKNVQTSERQLLFGNKLMRGAHHEQSQYILKMGVCYMKHYPDHLNPQGRMMHMCIRKLGPHSFITQANGGIFLTGYLVEIFSEILVKCNSFHTRKKRWKHCKLPVILSQHQCVNILADSKPSKCEPLVHKPYLIEKKNIFKTELGFFITESIYI